MDDAKPNPTAEEDPSRRRLAASVPWALFVAIPAVCAIALLSIAAARIAADSRRLDDAEAQVAGTWIADGLALVSRGARHGVLEAARARLGMAFGLYATDGAPVDGEAIEGLDHRTLTEALGGKIVHATLAGRRHSIAATTLRPPLSGLNVVAAIPRFAPAAPRILWRPAVVAAALLLLAVVVARAFGRGLRAESTRPGVDDRDAEEAVAKDGGPDALTSVFAELNGPLTRIVALCERLLDGRDGALLEAQQEDVRIVHKAGNRLKEMVGEIADLSSILGDDVGLDMEPVDLVEVAREVVETFRAEAVRKRLSVRLEAKGDPVWVHGNRQRLWQVATNLVANAVKFTDDGEVVASVRADLDGGAVLEVKDTGVGIAQSEQARVFDTFTQMGRRAGRKQGTGLGLAICRRLVELHGGRIDVRSSLGKGTAFTVRLPRCSS